MQLTEKWLKETLERNPQLKVNVQGGRNSELEQPKEVEKTENKIRKPSGVSVRG